MSVADGGSAVVTGDWLVRQEATPIVRVRAMATDLGVGRRTVE
jgi:hypothetical protein